MKLPATHSFLSRSESHPRGSVLVIVLWISFGLVTLALYFANSMTLELRGADNRSAQLEAEHAIEGAARYALFLLSNLEEPGQLPLLQTYQREEVPVADALFWFIGRGARESGSTDPLYALADESSKLNLNTATVEMLEALPMMTPELAAAIIDWRDENSDVTSGGAESESYLRLAPPYNCKNSKFETVEELRLVLGANPDILEGEDMNMNGVLDPNENDGNLSAPMDNSDGKLDAGILEYVTVFSRESNLRTNGSPRISLSQSGAQLQQQLRTLLQEKFSAQRANQIAGQLGGAQSVIRSPIEFFIRSRMTADEFAQIESDLTTTNGLIVEGKINVNTASSAVLACIPGVGVEKAASMVSFRESNPGKLISSAWVVEVLGQGSALQAGPHITGRSSVFSADIAAVGHHGRGFRRTWFVFDLTEGAPRVVYRQDLSQLGWPLGQHARQRMKERATLLAGGAR